MGTGPGACKKGKWHTVMAARRDASAVEFSVEHVMIPTARGRFRHVRGTFNP
jgi:polyisoprenoid-binding protein YceI